MHADWSAFVSSSLARAMAASRSSPPVRDAYARLDAGDLAGAARALAPLSEQALAALTLALSLAACERGVTAEVQRPLFEQLDARHPAGSKAGKLADIDEAWVLAWARSADGRLPTAWIAKVVARADRGVVHLAALAEARARSGRIDDARAFTDEIGADDKAWKATALAHIGVAEGRAGGDGEGALLTAARIACAPPILQDGGQEVDALADVLRVIAEAGLPASHPAVEFAVARILKMAQVHEPKDVRSHGVANAVEACATRIADPEWRAIGERLFGDLFESANLRRARAAWSRALGEPVPEVSPTSLAERYTAALLESGPEVAGALLRGDDHDAVYKYAAERLLALGRDVDAAAWLAPKSRSVLWILAKGAKDPGCVPGLLAASRGLSAYDRKFMAPVIAAAVGRLGATHEQLAEAEALADSVNDQGHRLEAYTALAATVASDAIPRLVERAVLAPPNEVLYDAVEVAVATAKILVETGRNAEAVETLWATRTPVSATWLEVAETTRDAELVRRIVEAAIAENGAWLTPVLRPEGNHTPPLAPLGRMLGLLPAEEADKAENKLLAVLDRPHFASMKVRALLTPRALDPEVAARRLERWLARWPKPSPDLLVALAPLLIADLPTFEPLLDTATGSHSDSETRRQARTAFAVALAMAGREKEAIALTEPIDDRRAGALAAVGEAVPAALPALAKVARKAKKGRDEFVKGAWYMANIRIATRMGAVSDALALLAEMPRAGGVLRWEAAELVCAAVESGPDPAGGTVQLLSILEGWYGSDSWPMVALWLPRLVRRMSPPEAANVLAGLGGLRARCFTSPDGGAFLDAVVACAEGRAPDAADAVHRCGTSVWDALTALGLAIVTSLGDEAGPALTALFRHARTKSPHDVARRLSPIARVAPRVWVASVAGAELPVEALRLTVVRTLPSLATDPHAVAHAVGILPNDEPFVRAGLAWLEVARLASPETPAPG